MNSVDEKVLQEEDKALDGVSDRRLKEAIIDVMRHKEEFKKLIKELMQDDG